MSEAVAEELRIAVATIRLIMADTDLSPFDGGTAGSGTTPRMAPQLRRVAAAARELLIDLGAEQAKVERGSLVVADGKVTHPQTKQSFTFGERTTGKKLTNSVGQDAHPAPAPGWSGRHLRFQGR